MYKKFLLFFLIIFTSNSYSQLYQGPASGSVAYGVIVSTDGFLDMSGEPLSPYVKRAPRNKKPVLPYPDYLNRVEPTAPTGSNIYTDPSLTNRTDESESNPMLLNSFLGFNDPGSYIPPDPYFAAGPDYVMGVDNSRFRIWDKSGNLLKSIGADSWFSTALQGAGAFDPKVLYDQISKRWIMVWLDEKDPPGQRANYLISVSDDSIPLGTWYNWAISSTLFGSTESNTWSDYEGVSFDGQALYITGRQFGFSGGFYGCKVRIIGKSQLYANTAGPLGWTDMWNIKDPGNNSLTPDNIRPVTVYGNPAEYYLMTTAPFYSGTYVILYKIINPLTSPSMTGADVPVVAYQSAPNAGQLGGGMGIEAGGSAIRNEPTYRNGFIWATHSVGTTNGYSNVNYIKINPATNTTVEDVSYGADGYYHFYPAISVDQNMNILLSYSRSGISEYIGAYFTSRLNTDPPGILSGSRVLQAGKSNYVKDFGSGRNRWGDYNGSWLDPRDPNNFWILTEYAEAPANTWACKIGNIRLVPFSGARIFTSVDSMDFGTHEAGTQSDTMSVQVTNFGTDTLKITALQKSTTQYQIISNFNFPLRLNYQDTVTVKLLFKPTSGGNIYDTLRILSNDNTTPVKRVKLKGKGFIIAPSAAGTMYGVTGQQEGGSLISINTQNGTGTMIGQSGFSELLGLSIKPSTTQIYSAVSVFPSTLIVRINASSGDAYSVATIPITNIRALAFDMNNNLYTATVNGLLYRVNSSLWDTALIGNTNITNLYGLTINPVNGQLWGISVSSQIYKINKQTAASVLIGNVGYQYTTSICFDAYGKLYASSGIGTQVSNLIRVDTSTGTGTLIGSTGKKGVNGIAISPVPIGIQPISSRVPEKYELYQNYPNPFNPSTTIRFDIPRPSLVKVKIFDIAGRQVAVLNDGKVEAGSYAVTWLAENYPSGVYFYRIETDAYSSARKMILIK